MYNFSYFKEQDKQVLLEFINDYPFAFLTGSDSSGKQVATQIPVLLAQRDGQWFIQGHLMRNTDHHKAFKENPQALAVFTGPHSYVSATWYKDQQSGSTWNYMSVHVKGEIKFLPKADLISFMKKLTLKFEDNNANSPTIFDNLPDDYLNKMMPGIVLFEIKVEQMENVFKLSQNKDEQSYRNIIARLLEKGGSSALVANEMKKRMDKLFVP
jgi:transcriptional regulator